MVPVFLCPSLVNLESLNEADCGKSLQVNLDLHHRLIDLELARLEPRRPEQSRALVIRKPVNLRRQPYEVEVHIAALILIVHCGHSVIAVRQIHRLDRARLILRRLLQVSQCQVFLRELLLLIVKPGQHLPLVVLQPGKLDDQGSLLGCGRIRLGLLTKRLAKGKQQYKKKASRNGSNE